MKRTDRAAALLLLAPALLLGCPPDDDQEGGEVCAAETAMALHPIDGRGEGHR